MSVPPKNEQSNSQQQWFVAQVHYIALEGGFFGLVTDQNQHFLPLNLPKHYCQHGAKVKLQGRIKHDAMTIQQWGTPFMIDSIELLSAGNAPDPRGEI
ncbi:hypothetical protein AAEU32_11315 [Pseudoalteromonas sp. SSDWG2]|uniref:hypothetical protein n=1 Tax=Pseudoalteromonas sp. SSDWG2 TaxID=3139391 RepID=UPI003BA9136E